MHRRENDRLSRGDLELTDHYAGASTARPRCPGAFNAMTAADEQELRALLERRAPHAAIRAKAAAIVADISGRHRSRGTVGKRLNTGRLDFQSPLAAIAGYESDIVENELPMRPPPGSSSDCRAPGNYCARNGR